MFTPGSRGCGYKTVSGRHEFLNQDPIQERGGINLYRTMYNNPVSTIDPLGLYVSITTANGVTTVVADTTTALTTALQEDVNSGNPVTDLTIAGHGAPNGGIITLDKDATQGLDDTAGRVELTDASGKNANTTDITDLLKNALAPNAKVHLNACDTANPSNNLAKNLSQTLSNTQVSGYPGTVYDPGFIPGLENFNAGNVFGSSAVTYVNGQQQ
jgi:hypothetical protein